MASEKGLPTAGFLAGLSGLKSAESIFKEHFKSEIQQCPSLSHVSNEVSAKIAHDQVNLLRKYRKVFVITVVTIFGSLGASMYSRLSEYAPYSQMAALAVGYSVEIALLMWINRRQAERRATLRLFHLICKLEKNPERWADTAYRWEVAQRIERVAVAVERISVAAGSLSPGVKREVIRMANARSACIRGLTMWAITPGPFSFTDLIERLVKDFLLLLNNCWHELPESDALQREPSRIRRISLAALGVLVIIAGIVVLVLFSAKFGAGGPILTSIIGIVGLALLNGAGLPLASVNQYADVSGKVMKGK